MKTYFDYEELERANLKEDEVKALLDAELMVKGVLKVDPPVFRTVPERPELKKERWYKVGELHFRTVEQADAFIKLDAHSADYNSATGYEARFAAPYYENRYASTGPRIEPVDLLIKSEVESLSKVLTEIRSATDANSKAREAYEKASSAMDKVIDAVWDDWSELQLKREKLQSIANTFDSYVATADGEKSVAAKFLLKAVPAPDVKKAAEWVNRPDIAEAVKPLMLDELETAAKF